MHLQFVVSLYHEQLEAGRFFLHEHPEFAASWQERIMQDLMHIPEVGRVRADQCQYGSEVRSGAKKGQPVKKPTGFLSNAPKLLEQLQTRCEGRDGQCSRREGGQHAIAAGSIASDAAVYPPKLVKAIIKGIIGELKARGMMKDGEVGINSLDGDREVDKAIKDEKNGYSGRYRDDMTGQTLRDDLVREARRQELEYFHQKGVWRKVPKSTARTRTGRAAISVRWVDVSKGDDLCPRYRSRLVARQLKARDKSGASFFAPTPPLEALRTVLSMAATQLKGWEPCYDPQSNKRMQISFIDISRAYFNAEVDPGSETYVQLPNEDADSETKVAMLLKHMYGTRAAADGWQEEYSSFLVEHLGFDQGTASPCVFRHPERMLITSVHGDDFTTAGRKCDLDWFEETVKAHYECTVQPRL